MNRYVPCPGRCGRKVWKVDQESEALHCPSCIAMAKAQVERHANLWAPIIAASMMMNGGRVPDIDPSLLRSA